MAADLIHGLKHYEAGRAAEALWWWQYSYVNHWGTHGGAALRALREERGMSLRELGKKCEVSHVTMIDIELGRRAMGEELVPRLASALGMRPSTLRGSVFQTWA